MLDTKALKNPPVYFVNDEERTRAAAAVSVFLKQEKEPEEETKREVSRGVYQNSARVSAFFSNTLEDFMESMPITVNRKNNPPMTPHTIYLFADKNGRLIISINRRLTASLPA